MPARHRALFLAVTALTGYAAPSLAATMDFESVPPGTRWGVKTGQTPGPPPVLSEDNIMMSVETFFRTAELTEFFQASIPGPGGLYENTFPTQELVLDNISVAFDFTDLGFDVNRVTLEYLDAGGRANLAVNQSPLLIVNELADLPAKAAPGITVMLQGNLLILESSGVPITRLLLGGQELIIDNVNPVPEPATCTSLAIGACAGFVLRRRRR